jgi:DNA-binding protein Fis
LIHDKTFLTLDKKVSTDPEVIKENYYKLFQEFLNPLFEKIIKNSNGNVYEHLHSSLEKAIVLSALKATHYNQVQASKLLGISRNTLRDRMKKFGWLKTIS